MLRLFNLLILYAFSPALCFSQVSSNSEIVINEILFNPSADGFDYVEIYNRGQRTIDLQNLLIANRNVTNDLSGLRSLAKNHLPLKPSSFCVITANEKWMKQNYSVSPLAVICELSSLPSFPDDEGTIILLNKEDSGIIDEVHYNKDWHFRLIADASGVALERISHELPSQDKNNWTSASFTSGFGTPGSVNSQFMQEFKTPSDISVSPAIFSPDNDGHDDFAFIQIEMNQPGYVANAIIYDISGRRIKYLIKNRILGLSDQFKWDGYDDLSKRVPAGAYIVATQIFNPEGNTKKFRNVIYLNYRNN